jgi:hydroxymethylbilane synthase
MSPKTLRIATRESRLAMRQTEMVAAALRSRYPSTAIEIVGMTTRGDQVLDRPLAAGRRQGPVREGARGGARRGPRRHRRALAEGRADGRCRRSSRWSTFGPREVPLDAFVSNRYASLASCRRRRRRNLEPAARVPAAPRLPAARDRALRGNVQHAARQARRRRVRRDHPRGRGPDAPGLEERIRATLPNRCRSRDRQGILADRVPARRATTSALLRAFEEPGTAAARGRARLRPGGRGQLRRAAGACLGLGQRARSMGFIGFPTARASCATRRGRPPTARRSARGSAKRLLAAAGARSSTRSRTERGAGA